MPAGFFHLTVLLMIAVTLPLRARIGASFALADAIAFPAAAVLLVEMLRIPTSASQLRSLYRANRAVFWYIGWSGVAAFIGLMRSTDSLKVYKDLIPASVLYVLVGLTVTDRHRLRTLLLAALPGVLCQLALALSQGQIGAPYITPTSSILEWKMDIHGELLTNVPVGLFGHPNALALFLMPVTLFAVALLGSASARTRLLLVALVLVNAWVLWTTQARGVFTFTAMGLILVCLPRRWERWRAVLAIVLPLLTIAGIVWLTVIKVAAGPDADDPTGQYGTIAGRLTLWLGGLELISSDGFTQIFGNGYPLFDKYNYTTADTPNAHSAWIDQILSFGLPGLVFYLASFVTALRSLCRSLTATRQLRGYAIGTVASLAAILGDNCFEPSDRGEVHTAQMLLLFAFAVVIPAASTRDSTGPGTQHPS